MIMIHPHHHQKRIYSNKLIFVFVSATFSFLQSELIQNSIRSHFKNMKLIELIIEDVTSKKMYKFS